MPLYSCIIHLDCLVLEDDDVAVLDLISRTGEDLNQPRGISGSSARVPDVDSYSRDGMQAAAVIDSN